MFRFWVGLHKSFVHVSLAEPPPVLTAPPHLDTVILPLGVVGVATDKGTGTATGLLIGTGTGAMEVTGTGTFTGIDTGNGANMGKGAIFGVGTNIGAGALTGVRTRMGDVRDAGAVIGIDNGKDTVTGIGADNTGDLIGTDPVEIGVRTGTFIGDTGDDSGEANGMSSQNPHFHPSDAAKAGRKRHLSWQMPSRNVRCMIDPKVPAKQPRCPLLKDALRQ
jgi:hypothetical protein